MTKAIFYLFFSNDILNASNEILIACPFVNKRKTQQMIHELEIALANKINVTFVTRLASDFTNKDLLSWNDAIGQLKLARKHLVFKSNILLKFVIFDQKIVWYSINHLRNGSTEESIMQIESTKIACELIGSLVKE